MSIIGLMFKTNPPIGLWEVNLENNTDRPSNQPTDATDGRGVQ